MNGLMNKGKGKRVTLGASGAGHGGSGGRGKDEPYTGLPYGNLYEPNEFGSSGGGPNSDAGRLQLVLSN